MGSIGLFAVVFLPIIGSFISYLIGRYNKQYRDYFANGLTFLVLIIMLALAMNSNFDDPFTLKIPLFAGFGINFVLDGFRSIYGVITAFMWTMTTIFSREYFAHYRNRNRYYLFMLLTFGATMGVFLSADLITTFIFFEMMSFASYVMVIHDEGKATKKAAETYMAVAVIGGLMILMGIFILNHYLGTLEINQLYHAAQINNVSKSVLYTAAGFMLVGFGGKAGMYILHIWLPNAHPVAPAPASALLSGVLTKTGVYGIIILSTSLLFQDTTWGMVILILGVLGMFTGALLALFSTNLKRTLACSSMSQIGFILVGVGMTNILGSHNALAIRGTVLHMVNHSLIKLVLFMMAGVVYMNLHELDLNKIRGFGRNKKIFTFAFLMGVLGIIGLPLWNGYVSKTLLHESIVEQIWLFPTYTLGARFFQVVESIFTLTGGLTTAYMIKIFVAVCIEKNPYNQDKMDSFNKKYMNLASGLVLFISALILPILGIFKNLFMMNGIGKLGEAFMHGHEPEHAVDFFAWINLRGAVASLSIGVIIYFFIVRGLLMKKDEQGNKVYINAWPKYLDIEEYIYRPLINVVLPFIGATFARVIGSIPEFLGNMVVKVFNMFKIESVARQEQGKQDYFANIQNQYLELTSKSTKAGQDIWEGEQDLVGATADFVKQEQPSIESDHFIDKLKYYQNAWKEKLLKWANRKSETPKEMYEKSEFAKVGNVKNVSDSLAYSFMLFLVGFVVILLVLILK